MADDQNPFDPQQDGRARVSATMAGAKARLNAKTRTAAKPSEGGGRRISRERAQWPTLGAPYRGIEPGAWREQQETDETGCLPDDCPVLPLGYDGEAFLFVDTRGQIFSTGTAAFGVERVQKLFAGHEAFLAWAWPAYNTKGRVIGFKSEEVRRDLYAACKTRGPFSTTDMVRGRGAWRDPDGALVLHCGEYLWHQGQLIDTGELGGHFYVRRPAATVPHATPVGDEDNPAVEIFEALRTWNMERRDTDAMLLLGFIGVAMLGGALNWRPSVFVIGAAGSGKSTLTGADGLIRTVLGRSVIATTNATEAGLYQIVGHDSLPIQIDEMEGDESPEQAAKIMKMARDAASGSVRIRGGQDHKGVEFQARSTFIFSGINPPGITPASLSRLAIIQLGKLPRGKPPVLRDPASIGPRLLRRCADGLAIFEQRLEDYSEVLAYAGHNARGQATFGTFLAAAHMLLGDAGMERLGLPADDLDHWGRELSADAVPEISEITPPWQQFLDLLWKSSIDIREHGEARTVGQMLQRLHDEPTDGRLVERYLAAHDIGLIDRRGEGLGYWLAVPNSSKVIGKSMGDTPFAARGGDGNWRFALGGGPDRFVIKQLLAGVGGKTRADNRFRVAGTQVRCLFVYLDGYRDWQAGQ